MVIQQYPPPKMPKSTLLIVDDEPLNLAVLARLLNPHYRVLGARSGASALELVQHTRPDLILLDVMMPGMDGHAVLRRLQADVHARTIPVIFITAFPERLLTGDKPEPAFLITKPFSEEQLRSAVSQAMFFASTETLVF